MHDVTGRAKNAPMMLIGALILSVIAAYGLHRLSVEYPADWVTIVPDDPAAESPRLALDRALTSITDADGLPRAGAKLPLATFVAGDGRTISVSVIEGQLFDRSIEPHSVWRDLGQNSLLVSSVDERRSLFGGLAEATTPGCNIAPTPGITQALGESSIAPCGGIYNSHFGIVWLARLSVIVDENPNSDNLPCWKKFGISLLENGYQDCVRKAVSSGLSNLFVQLGDSRYGDLQTVIIPAIGTGGGGLSKAAFYDVLLQDTLLPALDRSSLPESTLYLQVTRADTPERWEETKFAIASAVSSAASKWETTEHKLPSSEWLTLTGVALGGAAILFAIAFGWKAIALRTGFAESTGLTPLSLIAWIAAAVGVASMFKAFVTLAPTSYGPYVQLGAGVAAALLAGPLSRAANQAKDALQANPELGQEVTDAIAP